MLLFKNKKQIIEEGDLIVCNDKKTNKSVVISKSDRYYNTLVVGPTGCGKISRIILPCINQDIQIKDRGMTFFTCWDISERILSMAKYYDRKIIYLNPAEKNTVSINPLVGTKDEVIAIMTSSFLMLDKYLPIEESEFSLELLENSLTVLKELKGNNLNMLQLLEFIENKENIGLHTIEEYETNISNMEIVNWFKECYFPIYNDFIEYSRLVNELKTILLSEDLRKILIPNEHSNILDFDKHLESNDVLIICTNLGYLREGANFFTQLISNSFLAAIRRRPGNHETRNPHYLYYNQFEHFISPMTLDILMQNRSYRIVLHADICTKDDIKNLMRKENVRYAEDILWNFRNIIICPAIMLQDFGEFYKRFSNIKDKELITINDYLYCERDEVTYCIIDSYEKNKSNNGIFMGIGKIKEIPHYLRIEFGRIEKEHWDECHKN